MEPRRKSRGGKERGSIAILARQITRIPRVPRSRGGKFNNPNEPKL